MSFRDPITKAWVKWSSMQAHGGTWSQFAKTEEWKQARAEWIGKKGGDVSDRKSNTELFSAAVPGIAVPHADAPTPDHFEFIARVADALAGPNPKSTTNVEVESLPCQSVYRVAFDGRSETADDLSWAACKAALASLPSGGAR